MDVSFVSRIDVRRGPHRRGPGCYLLLWLVLAFAFLPSKEARAQAPTAPVASTNALNLPFRVNLGIDSGTQGQDLDVGIKVLFAITLLTLAPSIILLMTSFT